MYASHAGHPIVEAFHAHRRQRAKNRLLAGLLSLSLILAGVVLLG
jgi:hypothetical protein